LIPRTQPSVSQSLGSATDVTSLGFASVDMQLPDDSSMVNASLSSSDPSVASCDQNVNSNTGSSEDFDEDDLESLGSGAASSYRSRRSRAVRDYEVHHVPHPSNESIRAWFLCKFSSGAQTT